MIALIVLQLSIWFWIAIIEFVILVFVGVNLKKKPKLDFSHISKKEIIKLRSNEIDMNNLVDSINYSQRLFHELSKKCHPDSFIRNDQKEIAEQLFREISSNKRNYHKLLELKQKAIDELNIKF